MIRDFLTHSLRHLYPTPLTPHDALRQFSLAHILSQYLLYSIHVCYVLYKNWWRVRTLCVRRTWPQQLVCIVRNHVNVSLTHLVSYAIWWTNSNIDAFFTNMPSCVQVHGMHNVVVCCWWTGAGVDNNFKIIWVSNFLYSPWQLLYSVISYIEEYARESYIVPQVSCSVYLNLL